MIRGGGELDGTTYGTMAISRGLGLWPQVMVDQHFQQRRRFNRMLSAVAVHPKLPGIGIDESTAAVVNGETFEVIGESSMLGLDSRRGHCEQGKKGELLAMENITLHVLRSGMRFNVKTGKVIG